MVELEGDDVRIKARVDRMQNRASHGHTVVRIEHGRRVGEHHGDGVARADGAAGEHGSKPAAARVEFRVANTRITVDDGRMARIDRGCSLQEL